VPRASISGCALVAVVDHDLPRLDRRGASGERVGGGMQSEVASEITI
jgi:hypothetical protein